jgi:hypothetical protein
MPDEPDYYEVLQVSPRAEPAIIDVAYRKLAQKYHPDVNPDSLAHERMRELNQALEVLSDPGKRAAYDRRRLGVLAQRALAAKPPTFIFPPSPVSIGVPARLRHTSVTWLAIVGGLGITLVTMAMVVMQIAGGDGKSTEELGGLTDSERPARSFRAEGVQPSASPPALADMPATPTPPASPQPDTPSMPPQALAAVRDETRPTGSSAGPASATPAPAPIVAPPAPAPHTAPAPTPPPATPAPNPPTPTRTPAQCSASGTPQVNENGNQVSFTYGEVVSFEAGQPDVLVVDVAGSLLALAITNGTDVRGKLDTATVVNGQGRRARDGTIAAQLVEVICPQ